MDVTWSQWAKKTFHGGFLKAHLGWLYRGIIWHNAMPRYPLYEAPWCGGSFGTRGASNTSNFQIAPFQTLTHSDGSVIWSLLTECACIWMGTSASLANLQLDVLPKPRYMYCSKSRYSRHRTSIVVKILKWLAASGGGAFRSKATTVSVHFLPQHGQTIMKIQAVVAPCDAPGTSTFLPIRATKEPIAAWSWMWNESLKFLNSHESVAPPMRP